MTTSLPSQFLDNSLNIINRCVSNNSYSTLQKMRVLDRDNCPVDTLNVEGQIFYFNGQLCDIVVYLSEDKTKRLMLTFGKGAKIDDWKN